MKIKLKQLRPNPFRNLARYPIQRAKVEVLKASIRTTGFWDNVVVRESNLRGPDSCFADGRVIKLDSRIYEIAYGHHRLQALLELITENVIDEDFECDLPCRKLDDSTMVRIMAAENLSEFATSVEVIDETVECARAFIVRETRTPVHEIMPVDISQFLGGGWNEDKVRSSLLRLRLFDTNVIDRTSLAGQSPTVGRAVQREVTRVMKQSVRKDLEDSCDDDDEITEEDRKTIRTRAETLGRKVGEAMLDHARNGGSPGRFKEVSIDAQVEALPPAAPDDERKLSTIDAAARALNNRDFQRKVEMILKYKSYMSPGAKHELAGTLKEVKAWCDQKFRELTEE